MHNLSNNTLSFIKTLLDEYWHDFTAQYYHLSHAVLCIKNLENKKSQFPIIRGESVASIKRISPLPILFAIILRLFMNSDIILLDDILYILSYSKLLLRDQTLSMLSKECLTFLSSLKLWFFLIIKVESFFLYFFQPIYPNK